MIHSTNFYYTKIRNYLQGFCEWHNNTDIYYFYFENILIVLTEHTVVISPDSKQLEFYDLQIMGDAEFLSFMESSQTHTENICGIPIIIDIE